MSEPYKILVVEDSAADFTLIKRHLKNHGLAARCHRVDSLKKLDEALNTGSWDVVLSDYRLPQWDFLDCLHLLQARLPEVPVIVVSGTIGEEKAVELLKSGAWGFVLKDNLIRLSSVIERSLLEAAAIKERQQAEQLLRTSEERYRALFELLDEGFCEVEMLYDPNGNPSDYRFVEVNQRFEQQTGLQQILGKTLREVVMVPDPQVLALYGKVARTGASIRFESYNRVLQRYFNQFAFRIGGDGSQRVGILFNNITVRKQAEAEIERRDEELARLNTELTRSNRAMLNLLQDAVAAKDRVEQINQDLRGEITHRQQAEEEIKRKAAELQHSNAELERAISAKDLFLARMSHELRTPLNAILGFTSTLLMLLPGPLTPEQKKQLHTVQSSAKHLLSLMNDLLDLTKIESSTVELTFETVVCQRVVEDVATTLKPLAQKKGLDFKVRMPQQDVVVQADRRTLSRILSNLTNNAIKFTEKGGVVLELAYHQDNGHAQTRISVIDTGVGIKPEDQARLFQMFEQLDNKSTRKYEGTGVGLYLSQKLAELIGGHITFVSTYDIGSQFTLVLEGQ